MTPIVKYKKLDARAVVPQYATPGAAAADLCAVLDTSLNLVRTGSDAHAPAL